MLIARPRLALRIRVIFREGTFMRDSESRKRADYSSCLVVESAGRDHRFDTGQPSTLLSAVQSSLLPQHKAAHEYLVVCASAKRPMCPVPLPTFIQIL